MPVEFLGIAGTNPARAELPKGPGLVTVVSDLEPDWQTWHAAREQDLDTDYGWLTVVAFDWLPPAPGLISGLPGKWWADNQQASVTADGELTLGGEPVHGETSASVPEAGSLSWLLYGDRLAELVRRGGRYAVRQRDPRASTRRGFSGVPTYPLNPDWVVKAYYTPYPEPERVEVSTARDDLRQHVTAVGTVHLALGGSAYELAARWGDPLFSANGFHPLEKYAGLIRHYRERWKAYGRDPANAVVGAGFNGLYVKKTSQEAVEGYRPIFDAFMDSPGARHNQLPFQTLEEFLEGGSVLVGSPEQVIDKFGRYQEAFGHELSGVSLEVAGLPEDENRASVETFVTEVMPALRTSYPSRVWTEA